MIEFTDEQRRLYLNNAWFRRAVDGWLPFFFDMAAAFAREKQQEVNEEITASSRLEGMQCIECGFWLPPPCFHKYNHPGVQLCDSCGAEQPITTEQEK